MTLPPYFWLGVESEDYVSPTYSISYTNFDLDEGVPEDDLTIAFEADFHVGKLPEECPEECGMPVVDEADFGDE